MTRVSDPFGYFTASQVEAGEMSIYIVAPIVGVAALVGSSYTSTPYDRDFDLVGHEEEVDPDLLRAIGRQESNFRAGAVSPPNTNGTRDYGLMQINERTAVALGVQPGALIPPAPGHVVRSITLAARLLRAVRRELGERANYWTVIAAYNAGSPAILRRGIFNQPYVSSVAFHHQMYVLGSLIRKGG